MWMLLVVLGCRNSENGELVDRDGDGLLEGVDCDDNTGLVTTGET